MHRLTLLVSAILFACLGGLAAAPSATAQTFATPEDTVAAYIEGVANRDFKAVLAATSAAEMSTGFDFVAYVDRLGALVTVTPMPSSDPFFININRTSVAGQIARQVQFLVYGLMTTEEIIDGKTVMMKGPQAAEFAAGIDAGRLSGLAIVKVGMPLPELINGERYQRSAALIAQTYGADDTTERVALLSFEGGTYLLGFTLLRYGDEWKVMSQSSPVANTTSSGVTGPITPEAFEELLQ